MERALRKLGAPGVKDEGRLRAVLANCWAPLGFKCTQLDFKPIESSPYDKKLWEARYLRRSARSDGVHGYRFFYRLTRRPESEQQVAIILMLWAKKGSTTPKGVLDEAWKRYLEVEKQLVEETFLTEGE